MIKNFFLKFLIYFSRLHTDKMGLIIINVSSAEEDKEEIEANLNTFKLVFILYIILGSSAVARGIKKNT